MKAIAILLVAVATAAGAAQQAPNGNPAPNKALHAIFEREFKLGIEEHPESGTQLGLPGYNDRWSDLSPAAVARRKAHVPKVIAELERFATARLSTQDRISRDVFLYGLRRQLEEDRLFAGLPFGSEDSWLAVSPTDGPQFTVPAIVKSMPFATVKDYENYLKRLEALPKLLAQTRDALQAGIASGWVAPRETMPRVPGMLAVFAGADVTATPLWRPFTEFPAGIGAADRERLAAAGRRVLAEKVHPAFAQLQRYVEDRYMQATRATVSASRLPGGPTYYAILAKNATTTDLTPEEIHAIGLKEVARIRAEMDRVIGQVQFKGSFADFLVFLARDPQFFFKTPEARLMAYRDIAKRADAALPPLFATLPRTPYGIRPMEAYEGDNADHYARGALDGSRAGFFDANVNNLATKPSHEMESVLLHEAVPGHHLQIARAAELQGLPEFRRSGYYTAYTEGWALYAESLGEEMGFYKDPYMRFGALMGEMLRATRLVVDTGLHAKEWSRPQAIRYMVDNGAGNEDMMAAEVDRYIVSPGQALGYKIGSLRIQAMRARAKAALGERFDIRAFHNALLDDGPLPLAVLEARIDEWIAVQKRRAKA